jgi:hypothetical protein
MGVGGKRQGTKSETVSYLLILADAKKRNSLAFDFQLVWVYSIDPFPDDGCVYNLQSAIEMDIKTTIRSENSQQL